ncbi:TnsA endonuclease N-terminal domain-containing protein [Dechloromonas denitrificans]|uniref:TnsA endonuclease N-terminal domain-containing protein n=1 Tax=Dechloromonas denitrificans TaxID=281362 RepID=UPI001CFB9B0C|nr:TnsA endonuclease N-terminal domain-containing protein [Dechloromonas denitrificans]UCV07003.1 TnsA endonuclease N-terminal domain-containing protein [Dechloromonas denitrificans]
MTYQVEIEFAEEERARRVISRSNSRVTGKYPGLKSGRMHYWESSLEQDAFYLLDVAPEVVSYIEQPAVLYYGDDLKTRHYPDVLVTYQYRQEFVEIKSNREATSQDVITRTAILVPALACHGYGYRVWTEAEIRDNSNRLANLRFLLRFGRAKLGLPRFEWFRQLFAHHPVLPWKSIVGQPTDTGKLAGLCRLILEGRLRVDLTQPILSDSLVTIGEL